MPIVNRVVNLLPEIQAWRQEIHAHPELGYNQHRTSTFVADRLREFGCDEVVTGIGQTGVVGVIRGAKPGAGQGSAVIGLRADMDALPIEEATGLPYASRTAGAMHACGHDGHTAMLLGAARYLAETRNFCGTTVVIFQPAEEAGAGAAAMLEDGLMERFGIREVYGMHNLPGLPIGSFATRHGPVLGAADPIRITIEGLGGHSGNPHECINPVLVGTHLVSALQQIVAFNVDPREMATISICVFQAGVSGSVIPPTAELEGRIRTASQKVREAVRVRIREIAAGVATMTGAKIKVTIEDGYPVTYNHKKETDLVIRVASEVAGEQNVSEKPIEIASEDFSFMLQVRPGSFLFCGNGSSEGLHHPAYDFNDEAIPHGVSFWIRLVETALAD
ncbi:M20 aminoacylase family protein [Rhizobium miluonense]|uniref:M20 aminoacylase family protein n=1 Tax=Rhizobium miluonense TaxID=411945 RepID=UPI000B84FA48|nr:M20 aminoacylase family protein [Rhizobium miluonense]